ncbi:hypothetical protein J6590_070483 [Homalodisca vitripennis]|nr:hypothetical protein J6590_070483 [Homalodisca vitripennis]
MSVDGANSQPLPVKHGVPQDSTLEPVLFLVMINDLEVLAISYMTCNSGAMPLGVETSWRRPKRKINFAGFRDHCGPIFVELGDKIIAKRHEVLMDKTKGLCEAAEAKKNAENAEAENSTAEQTPRPKNADVHSPPEATSHITVGALARQLDSTITITPQQNFNLTSSAHRRGVPVYKWGLQFNGQSQSVGAFLQRAEELRRALGVTTTELSDSAVDLFTGPALTWYRSTIGHLRNWEQLCRDMELVFQHPDHDIYLQQEVFNRVQAETELEQLRVMGRKAEAGRLRSITTRAVASNVGVLEPDLAYPPPLRGPTRSNARPTPEPGVPPIPQISHVLIAIRKATSLRTAGIKERSALKDCRVRLDSKKTLFRKRGKWIHREETPELKEAVSQPKNCTTEKQVRTVPEIRDVVDELVAIGQIEDAEGKRSSSAYLTKPDVILKGISGRTLKTYGRQELTLKMKPGIDVVGNFVVENHPKGYLAVLGCDILGKGNGEINVEHGLLWLYGGDIWLNRTKKGEAVPDPNRPSVSGASPTQQCYVSNDLEGKDVVIEPPDFIMHGVYLARTLTKVKGNRCWFKTVNANAEELTLPKNLKLGTLDRDFDPVEGGNPVRQKLLVLADSHGRGLQEILSERLPRNFDVEVFFMPNGKLKQVTSKFGSTIDVLTENDTVILIEETNNVDKCAPYPLTLKQAFENFPVKWKARVTVLVSYTETWVFL